MAIAHACRSYTGLASSVVVMEIEHGAVRARRPVASTSLLAGVDERLGKRHSVRHVVRAAGPLEAAAAGGGGGFTIAAGLSTRRRLPR